MRMVISGKHLEITEAIRDYSEKKVGKIKRYFDNILEVDVTLSVEHTKSEGDKHIADVLIFANGTKIKASATDVNLYASIDEVVDILENQVTKYKEKLRDNRHRSSEKMVLRRSAQIPASEAANEEAKRIVTTQLTAGKPMSVEEAVLQMEAMGDEFYTFMNHETEEMNVVYRRKDGEYGHVEPAWGK